MKQKARASNDFARLRGFLESSTLTWIIAGFFVLQASWFAVSFAYGMVFDEDYHFSIVKAYTEQLGPVIYDQPPSLDHLRDLENEGSFLYHYMMSFPLRLIMPFTESAESQITILRLINVGFVAAALLLYATLLVRVGISRVSINIGLLFFSLIPIFPYISATVNYDNLLLLAMSVYLLVWTHYLKGNPWQWSGLLLIIVIGLFASLVKITFLPVFAVSLVVLSGYLIHHRRKDGLNTLKI